MENLHAPTVPSGPITAPATSVTYANGQSLAQLQAKKDNVEAEMRALGSVLESHGVDMNTRLITQDGFPRADLDVAQIRTTRSRIIYLRNDYKALMAVIEKYVHEEFARRAADSAEAEPTTNGVNTNGPTPTISREQPMGPPFAKVNSVISGSPAETAGLQAGDEIRNFGYVDISNHDGLRRVGQCVQGNEGQNVLVKISRHSTTRREELQLTLIPRSNWGGRGLLGCHILPL
ncbi:26S proteasome non-ATPase-like protein regulatory subunit 9 [Calycina marina]|uniref:Probable 26S proteasome regulatory subunit p27 n=1 Tax=Calycina marina TaxID=1763456 RepID=A0A9P8CHQ6_9HELO|nr:26S proteasome non-ATPase-like protein regulatory subunit 9 [Calycina marina]